MKPAYINAKNLDQFIDLALEEDLQDGDHTTLAVVPQTIIKTAQLKVKSEGIIAGVEFAEYFWKKFDPEIEFKAFFKDGAVVNFGDIVFTVTGKAQSILSGERLVLNCMQRMSGIATKTKRIAEMLHGAKAKVLDTRKTTPNFRMLEKWAVYIGGGINHRFGLFDQILLKDNHVDIAGGVVPALKAANEYLSKSGKNLKIEIETRTVEEVREALSYGKVDIIMLDNMMPSAMKEAIRLINGRVQTEASGGITELNINEVADSGIDFISIGALTHSYTSLDMNLKII